MTKTYTQRPARGNARLAWDALEAQTGPIVYMFFSRDHVDGPRWVSYHGDHQGAGGYTGTANSPIIGGGGIYSEITPEEISA